MADVIADAAGKWSVTLPKVAPGLHQLRADQIDGTGKVLSRFETPFLREAVNAPADVAGTAGAPVASEGAAASPAADAAAGVAQPVTPDLADVQPSPAPAPIRVTVQPGLTLWEIARDNFGDGVMYVQVFEANRDKIKDPDLIYPGQVFVMPEVE
jgi:nucleoid-associated protein YgaU